MARTTDITTLHTAWLAGAPVVDVREPDEYADGHVPGALLLPMDQVANRIGELPPDREIFVICRSGRRSQVSADVMETAGLRAVSVDGGTLAWIDAGHPVE